MSNNCECAYCKNDLPFEIPKEIIQSLLNQQLVLFAGAGISTETKQIFKETLYEEVFLDLEEQDENISFPNLMSKFCRLNNGKQKLLEKIKKRFDYTHQYSELYSEASKFHKEVSKFWMIENIITTNWDDHFERECNAIPIVTAEDFAFYNINQRKVFKIHGSISNYGSIIATKEDYEKCYESLSTGLIGANLKTLLATKTILFVGYSFRDFDFIKVIELLKKEMGEVFPHFYIISLDDNFPDSINGLKFTHIKTSGTFFFENIREHFINKQLILPDELFKTIYHVKYSLIEAQSELHEFYFEKQKNCSVLFSSIYQDGISHAIDYLIFKSKTGESYNPLFIINQIKIYENDIKKRYTKSRNYMEIAYVNGYINGLAIPFFFDEIEDFPYHFIYGLNDVSDKELAYETYEKDIIRHKSSEKYGRQYFKEYLKDGSDMILRHRPFL